MSPYKALPNSFAQLLNNFSLESISNEDFNLYLTEVINEFSNLFNKAAKNDS